MNYDDGYRDALDVMPPRSDSNDYMNGYDEGCDFMNDWEDGYASYPVFDNTLANNDAWVDGFEAAQEEAENV